MPLILTRKPNAECQMPEPMPDARAKMQGQVKWAIIFKASNF